jgi:hypothetical protein
MGRNGLLAVVFALALGACRSASPAPEDAVEEPIAPLAQEGAPLPNVHVPLGAREARELFVVFTESSQSCSEWLTRAELQGAFVLCSGAASVEAEKELKATLAQLKKSYPRHLTKKTISVIVAKSELDHELDMILSEPSVFSKVLLLTEATRRLNVVFFATYGERGGKKFLVVSKNPTLTMTMSSTARAAGVTAKAFSGGIDDVPVALAELLR